MIRRDRGGLAAIASGGGASSLPDCTWCLAVGIPTTFVGSPWRIPAVFAAILAVRGRCCRPLRIAPCIGQLVFDAPCHTRCVCLHSGGLVLACVALERRSFRACARSWYRFATFFSARVAPCFGIACLAAVVRGRYAVEVDPRRDHRVSMIFRMIDRADCST